MWKVIPSASATSPTPRRTPAAVTAREGRWMGMREPRREAERGKRRRLIPERLPATLLARLFLLCFVLLVAGRDLRGRHVHGARDDRRQPRGGERRVHLGQELRHRRAHRRELRLEVGREHPEHLVALARR